jgi:hypothetical protein
MEALPITIRKTWFGYVVIVLAGALVIGLTYLGISSILSAPGTNMVIAFGLAALIIITTLAITIIQLYVYSLSFITLTTEGIVVKNWITLFVSKDESLEWQKVTKAESAKGGIFGQVLDYGTLSIGTSDGDTLVNMKMIPAVEHWQAVIQQQADAAPTKVTTT